MFIGHLPAAYLCSSYLNRRNSKSNIYLYLGLIGGFFPDIDLLTFYFIDYGHIHHHKYATHIPFFYCVFWLILALVFKQKPTRKYIHIFFINCLLHIALDSIVGSIMWLYPYSLQSFNIFDVQNLHSPWQLNFLLHPSFGLELILILITLFFYKKRHAHKH